MVVPNNHGFFLLKMIILGCLGGNTIYGNTHIVQTKKNFSTQAAYATWYSFSISSLGRIRIHGAQKLGLDVSILK